jgi:hypothetical protein
MRLPGVALGKRQEVFLERTMFGGSTRLGRELIELLFRGLRQRG